MLTVCGAIVTMLLLSCSILPPIAEGIGVKHNTLNPETTETENHSLHQLPELIKYIDLTIKKMMKMKGGFSSEIDGDFVLFQTFLILENILCLGHRDLKWMVLGVTTVSCLTAWCILTLSELTNLAAVVFIPAMLGFGISFSDMMVKMLGSSLVFVVRDNETGEPIDDAVISAVITNKFNFLWRDETFYANSTDYRGTYVIEEAYHELPPAIFRYEVKADGYKTYTGIINAEGGKTMVICINLQRSTS